VYSLLAGTPWTTPLSIELLESLIGEPIEIRSEENAQAVSNGTAIEVEDSGGPFLATDEEP
jgi:hypothetical protein